MVEVFLKRLAILTAVVVALGFAVVAYAGTGSISGTASWNRPLTYEVTTANPGHFLATVEWQVKSSKDIWSFEANYFSDPDDPWSYHTHCWAAKLYRDTAPQFGLNASGTPGSVACEFDASLTGYWVITFANASRVSASIEVTHPD